MEKKMADLTITSANVRMGDDNTSVSLIAAEDISSGDVIRVDNNQIYKAIASSTVSNAAAYGIAITSGTTGNKVSYVTNGTLTIGATLVLNTLYVLSATSGKIAPFADLTTGQWVTLLGVPKSTSLLSLNITSKGFAIP